MQAYAEGFDILRHANSDALPQAQRFDLNVADIAEVWRRGSVIQSWLLDLTSAALAGDRSSRIIPGIVADSGEGRWTVMAALEEAVPGGRALCLALCAVPLARAGELRRQAALRHAPRLRRPCRAESPRRDVRRPARSGGAGCTCGALAGEPREREAARFTVALAGGSTPRLMYEKLADENFRGTAPTGSGATNASCRRVMRKQLPHGARGDAWRAPRANIHPVPTTGISPEEAAARYEKELREFQRRARCSM